MRIAENALNVLQKKKFLPAFLPIIIILLRILANYTELCHAEYENRNQRRSITDYS